MFYEDSEGGKAIRRKLGVGWRAGSVFLLEETTFFEGRRTS